MVLASALFLTGCLTINKDMSGSIVRNKQVEDLFHNREIKAGYTYYYNGEILEPNTIIAIDKVFTFDKELGFWTKIDLNKEQLEKWMWMFSTVDGEFDEDDYMTIYYEGFEIISPNGKHVGLYFSKYHEPIIKFPSEYRVVIYKPEPPLMSRIFKMGRMD